MELDDLKNTWNEISDSVNEKQNLNIKMFDKMSRKKIQSRLSRIVLPEIAGSAVCIGAAVYIIVYFSKLNSLFLQCTGVLAIIILLAMAVLSYMSIRQLLKTGDLDRSYSATLQDFSVYKFRFCKLQKLNLMLSYFLLFSIAILVPKLFAGKDVTVSRYFWVWTFGIGCIILVIFSGWVTKKYSNTIRQTEELLKELKS